MIKKTTLLLVVGIAAMGLQNASAAIISLYQFDDSLTDTVRGAPGAASLVTGSSSYIPGIVGQAFEFDGSTFMKAPMVGAGLSNFSISSWVYFDTQTEFATIVKNWGDFTAGAYHLGLDQTTFTLSNFIGTDTGSYGVTSGVLTAGSWYHVAVTLGSLTQTLYINGAQVATGSASGTLNNTRSDMSMGGKLNEAQDGISAFAPGWLDGSLDELAFLNQELTSAQVASIYNAGLAGNSITTVDLNPVPEPSTYALLVLAGLFGAAVWHHRRQKVGAPTELLQLAAGARGVEQLRSSQRS